MGRTLTQHSHYEVLAGLGLGILGHAGVGTSLGQLQATHLEAAPTGDHATHHAALCGTEGQASLSPAALPPQVLHLGQTQKSRDSLTLSMGLPAPTLTELERPQEPLNHSLLSCVHRETGAQTEAGPPPIRTVTFPSLVFVLTTLPYFLPPGRFFPSVWDSVLSLSPLRSTPPPTFPPAAPRPLPLTQPSDQGEAATH